MTFSDDLDAVRARAGVPRFAVRRHALEHKTERPWVTRDYTRPHWLGSDETHADAIARIDETLRHERGDDA